MVIDQLTLIQKADSKKVSGSEYKSKLKLNALVIETYVTCNDCALFVFFILDADVKLIPSVVSGVNFLTLNSLHRTIQRWDNIISYIQ